MINPTNNLPPFKYWCQKVLPAVYDDSLSYYELLCKVVAQLNTTINAVNNNGDAVTELQQKYTEFTNNITEQQNNFENSITEQQNNYEQQMTELYNELKSYVDNYFTNLDVQNEINNKLDAMAQDGTLQNIISSYLTLNGVISFENVNQMKSSSSLVAGSTCRTLGYLSLNDNGGALYKVINSEQLNNREVDEGSIIQLQNNLYAELIHNENEVNILNFGYTLQDVNTNGQTPEVAKNITTSLQKAINYLTNNGNKTVKVGLKVIFPDDIYYINNTIDLKNTYMAFEGGSLGERYTAIYATYFVNKIYTSVDGTVFENGTINCQGLNFHNLLIDNTNTILFDVKCRILHKCFTANYGIVLNQGVTSVGLVTDNQLLGCTKYAINGNIVDSFISNNYINGKGQNAIGINASVMNLSNITQNFIDFCYTGIKSLTQTINVTIADNIIDYCFRGIIFGGVIGCDISNNNFTHANKQYHNHENNNYPDDSAPATSDWIGIVLNHTQKGMVITGNNGVDVDLLIDISNPTPNAYSSIITANNTISKSYLSTSFLGKLINLYYSPTNKNIAINELNNNADFTVMPTPQNTVVNNVVNYNNMIYKNSNGNILTVGIKNYENYQTLSYKDSSSETSTIDIDLSQLSTKIEANEIYLEILTTVDSYLPVYAKFKILRINSVFYAIKLFQNGGVTNTEQLNIVVTPNNEAQKITISLTGTHNDNTAVVKTIKYKISVTN